MLLFDAVHNKCQERGISIKVAATELQMSEGYLRALFSKERRVDGLGMDSWRKFAEFLGIPITQTMLLGGVLAPADFIFEKTIDDEFEEFLSQMRRDSEFGPILGLGDGLEELPDNTKIALMMLYERAFKVKILEKVKAPKNS